MITNPDTSKRVQAQADAYAADIVSVATDAVLAERIGLLLRNAYLAGAETGYVARLVEEMVKP